MNNKFIIGIVTVVVVIGGIIFLQQSDTDNKVLAGTFSTDITGLPGAKPSDKPLYS